MARQGGPKPLYIAVNGALGLHCGDSELFWSVLVLQWDALGLHSGCFGLPVVQKFVIPEWPAAEGSRLEHSGVWGWRLFAGCAANQGFMRIGGFTAVKPSFSTPNDSFITVN